MWRGRSTMSTRWVRARGAYEPVRARPPDHRWPGYHLGSILCCEGPGACQCHPEGHEGDPRGASACAQRCHFDLAFGVLASVRVSRTNVSGPRRVKRRYQMSVVISTHDCVAGVIVCEPPRGGGSGTGPVVRRGGAIPWRRSAKRGVPGAFSGRSRPTVLLRFAGLGPGPPHGRLLARSDATRRDQGNPSSAP